MCPAESGEREASGPCHRRTSAAQPVGAAAVGGDGQLAHVGITLQPHPFSPSPDRLDGELGRVARDTEIDKAHVGGHVVDAVGGYLTKLLVLEIVPLDA